MASPDNMASSNTASGVSFPALSPSVVPANPFAKTLASMEPQRAGGEDRASAEGATLGNNRASLDVESFKNMLLTGKPYPRQSTQAPQSHPAPSAASAAIVESGSSTDASSISRQSLLEPAHEAPVESPRTSYEMARSDEDEVAGLTPERTRSKRKPPPAPAHRHGKLVSPRQPQVVPFDSFAASGAAPSPVTRPRNTSDTNKPLPPTPILSPPPLNIDTPEKTQDNVSPEKSDDSLSRSNSLQQKRVPPPVPLARRQSQLRHSSAENRSRSNSSLTLSSQHSLDVPAPGVIPTPGEIASNATTTASLKSPPPPPPSRHGARLSDIGSSSVNSSSTELPQRSTSVRTTGSSHGPSSRRSTLEGEPELPVSRAASTASKRNSLRLASGESTGSIMPPPPPPPRRRPGSGRSSLDQQRPHIPGSSPTESRRTSTEHRRTSTDLRRTSLDNNRRTSGASEHSLRYDYAPAEEKTGHEYALYSPREEAEDTLANAGAGGEGRKDSNNILDDMEKFQREIDELRNRYKQAG